LITSFDKPIILIGGGGHSKVLIDALNCLKTNILGIVDPHLNVGSLVLGIKVLGDDEVLKDFNCNQIELVNAIGIIPHRLFRLDISKKFVNQGYKFKKVTHPSAIVASSAKIGNGVQILAGSVIQSSVTIGDDCIINTGALIDHDCMIGKGCHVAPGVTLCGGISIDENTFIGAGSTVIQNVSIGSNCTIAAGSIIYKDIPDKTTVIQKRINIYH
jgi:sugar O-acyltransferase (sialic acid O-acetyltransferase NeuD family)